MVLLEGVAMKKNHSNHHLIMDMFALSLLLFFLTIPGQLYDYYTRNLVWYGILILASVSLNVGWCIVMYQYGKSCNFSSLWAIVYFLLCMGMIAFQIHKQIDTFAFLLLPVAVVMFLWQRIGGIFIQQNTVLDAISLLIPSFLFVLFFIWGYQTKKSKH